MRKTFEYSLMVCLLLLMVAPLGMAATTTSDEAAVKSQILEKVAEGVKLSEAEQDWYSDYKTSNFSSPGLDELDQTGGPDAFGYIFTDSNEDGGPTYSWVDITGTGTAESGLEDDNFAGPFSIGFDFPFYGQIETEFYIGSNGIITFNSDNADEYSNTDLPNSSTPNDIVALYWDDLKGNYDDSTPVYYQSTTVDGQNALVVSFIDYRELNFSGTIPENAFSGQIILFEDGSIRLQYDYVGANIDRASLTVGIENADGTVGLAYNYNNADTAPTDGLAIDFTLLEADASISGTVTDASTSDPVAGAAINIGPYTATSGEDGTYSIEDVFSGTYDVSATAHGFYSYSEAEVVVAVGANTINIAMDSFPTVDVSDDFEGGSDNWVVYSNLETPMWQYGTPDFVDGPAAAYSGSNLFGTNLVEDYVASTDDTLMYAMSFVPEATSMLAYQEWMDTETFWDGYNVEISTDGGDTWTIIDPFIPDGYNDDDVDGIADGVRGFSGHLGEWRYVVFDVSAYEGMETWVRFIFGSDGSGQYPGVYIDDFELRGVTSLPVFSGTVTDVNTEAAIEGATIEVYNDAEEMVGSTMTDADGMYSISVPEGSLSLTASAAGYLSSTMGPYEVAYGDEMTVDFTLGPPEQNYTVNGVVMSADTEDTPVGGVAVTIIGLTGFTTFTNASGEFSFADVPEGAYSFYLTHNPIGSMGFHDATIAGVEINAESTTPTLYMPEILAPTITAVNAMDSSAEIVFDAPANHAEPTAIRRGIEFRQNTIDRLEGATDAKANRVRAEMSSELVILQRRLDLIQNHSGLDELVDFEGYRLMLNGILMDNEISESPYVIPGLTNGTLYWVQIAADYGYNEANLAWSEEAPAYPIPTGLYEVTEVEYSWVEIRPSEDGAGTALSLTDDGESDFIPMPDGWSYMHYGVAYDQFSVSPNGWLSFIHNNGGLSGTIPSTSDPDAAIFPYWRDQDPGDTDEEDAWYWFDEENEQVVVQWHTGNYPGPSNNIKDYELILDLETNSVTIQYNTSVDGWSGDEGVTIGIENAEGTVGLTYDHANIVDSHAINFHPLMINFGTLAGTITDATTSNPIQGAIVTATDDTGVEYVGASDENGYYQVRLVDRANSPWDLSIRAGGYVEASLTDVDFGENDTYVHEEDIEMTPIDPMTPPTILSTDGYFDNGIQVVLGEPGALVEFDYLQWDDGVVDNATGWNPGYTSDYWFATKFVVPGEGVQLQASDLRFLIFSDFDMWWPEGDESHQPVVIGVFNDDGTGLPGELVWTSNEMTPSETDPTLEVAPGIGVTSTFFVGFQNVTPEAGQEPLSLDTSNDNNVLYTSTDGGSTWGLSSSGDPMVRASVMYVPLGGTEPVTANVTPSQDVVKAAVSNTELVFSLPVYGLQKHTAAPANPRFFPYAGELDEFIGFNVEYSTNGTDWTAANEELIDGPMYFIELGSENEDTEYTIRANAVVTDPEGGDDITSNYSDEVTETFNMPPAAPTDLAGAADGLEVALSWTVPTTNEDGTELVDLEQFKIWLLGEETTLLGTSDTDGYTATMDAPGFYGFVVTAEDEVPNVSQISEGIIVLAGDPSIETSFEPGEWNELDAPDGVWELGTPTAGPGEAHTGSNAWATVLDGDYGDVDEHASLYTTAPYVVNTTSAIMTYWHWLDYETGWDGYNVKVSADGGATWEIIDPVGGYPNDEVDGIAGENADPEPGFTGHGMEWQQVIFPLGAYQGQAIIIRFHHGSDWISAADYGVALDDLSLYGVEPPDYGTVSGIARDCAEDGPGVAADVYVDGRMLGTANVDGTFDFEVISGEHNFTFRHTNFWDTGVLEQTVPVDGELDLGNVIMTRPIPEVDPTTLSMDIDLSDQDPVSSTFELSNEGCGIMEYSVSVNILNAANEVIGSYPENVLPGDITEVEDLPYFQSTKQSAATRGPVAVSELDETWDLLDTFDADAISGAQDNLSAWIDGSSGYIMQFNSPYNIYEFDFSGNLLDTHTPSTGGAQWWNETEYDPTTGLVMTAAASGAVYQFMPDGSNATNIGSVGQDAWGIAYDYDNGIVYWANAFEQSAWGMLNLSTSQNTTLNEPSPGGYPWAMMYVPTDPNGNTIYGAFSEDPTVGPVGIYGYNPTTMAWTSNPIVTLYGDGSYAVVGMTGTHDWSGNLDYVIFTQGDGIPDLVDIYEGMTLQSWLYVDPSIGTLLPGESATITVTVDHAADPTFNPVDGQNVTAQVIVSGPKMVDSIVTVDMFFTSAGENDDLLPAKYALHQNYPNPFNPSTSIKFDLVASQNVKLTVYNMLGQEVARLVDGQMQAGYHNVSFDASRLASGVYFYRMETPAFTKMRKMVLVK